MKRKERYINTREIERKSKAETEGKGMKGKRMERKQESKEEVNRKEKRDVRKGKCKENGCTLVHCIL